jgi:hypothetical protein
MMIIMLTHDVDLPRSSRVTGPESDPGSARAAVWSSLRGAHKRNFKPAHLPSAHDNLRHGCTSLNVGTMVPGSDIARAVWQAMISQVAC